MENYNGIAISKNDKEFVVAFDNFVNGKMQSANQRDGSFGLLWSVFTELFFTATYCHHTNPQIIA